MQLPPLCAVDPRVQDFLDWELVLLGGILLTLLLVSYQVVVLVRGRQRQDEAAVATPSQQLEQYRDLVEQGLLAPEEFDKLKARLSGRKADGP